MKNRILTKAILFDTSNWMGAHFSHDIGIEVGEDAFWTTWKDAAWDSHEAGNKCNRYGYEGKYVVAVSYPYVAVATIGETGSTVMNLNLFTCTNAAEICQFQKRVNHVCNV